MANELTKHGQGQIAVIDENSLGDIIKPLIREIHLFDSFVAGTTHINDNSILDDIKEGDEFTLIREENRFDDNAIMVLNADKIKIGYIPEKDNVIFARLMDAGKILKAKASKISRKGSFTRISIGIYLVDI